MKHYIEILGVGWVTCISADEEMQGYSFDVRCEDGIVSIYCPDRDKCPRLDQVVRFKALKEEHIWVMEEVEVIDD